MSGEFVPLYIFSESPTKNEQFRSLFSRVVVYGPINLRGKSKKFYDETGRKTGEVIAAHEIINKEAISNPQKLFQAPHIHWEIDRILEKNYCVNFTEKLKLEENKNLKEKYSVKRASF